MDPIGAPAVVDKALEGLVVQVLQHLTDLKYTASTRVSFLRAYRRFLRFVRERAGDDASLPLLSQRYLAACKRHGDREYRKRSGQELTGHAMRVLIEFSLQGRFRFRTRSVAPLDVSPALEATLADYLQFCEDYQHHARGTLITRSRDLRTFFQYLRTKSIADIDGIDIGVLSDFIATRNPAQTTLLCCQIGSLRSFLRYLVVRGRVSAALVEETRAFTVQRPNPLPAVWSREDVLTLLSAVDRGSPVGKRDYAILMLAAKLGMRAGDIRKLRLEDILWDEGRIDIVQEKTSEPLSLPLPEDVGEAIIEYLRHGRPVSHRREIFLRGHAPYDPFTMGSGLSAIITRYRLQAGLLLATRVTRCGMHSLRHSLASRLMEAATPLPVISAILGHGRQESTATYIRIDFESLRDVALGLEEVTDACP